MNIPAIVTNPALRKLASPGETHEVHVIIRRMVNQAPYTLRGRRRQYIVPRDNARNAHILKVPLSAWMHGCDPSKPVAENDSIAYDLQSSRTGLKSPLTFEIVRIQPIQQKEPSDSLETICLLETMVLEMADAIHPEACKELLTPYLIDAINRPSFERVIEILTEAGRTEILDFISTMDWEKPKAINIASPADEDPKPEETKPAVVDAPTVEKPPLSNAERQKLHRARKKAEKEAAEAAKLQPA